MLGWFKARIVCVVQGKISNAFLIIFTLFLLLVITPIAWHVVSSVSEIAHYSKTVHKEELQQQAAVSLKKNAAEKALFCNEYFSNCLSLSKLLTPQVELHFKSETPSDIFDHVVQQFINDLSDVSGIFLQTAKGDGKYYTINNGEGKTTVVASGIQFNATLDLFSKLPLNEVRDGIWISPWLESFHFASKRNPVVTVVSPFTDPRSVEGGVVGIELALDSVSQTINQTSSSANTKEPQSHYSFIVDKENSVLTTKSELFSFFFPGADTAESKFSEDISFFPFETSRESKRITLNASFDIFSGGVKELKIGATDFLIVSSQLPVTGWNLLTFARKDELVAPSKAKEKFISFITNLKLKIVFYTLLLLGIFVTCSYLAIRYFVGPIEKLSLLAQKVGEGDLSSKSTISRNDEIGALSMAMNTMIDSLAEAESFKKDYFVKLQNGINQRTADLNRKTLLLSEVMRKMHHESEKRKKISTILREREKQLLTTMEASLAGLCIVQGGKFKYVNSAIEEMFGYSKDELVNNKGPIDLVAPEFNTEVMQRLMLRERDELQPGGTPHHVRCKRKNGEVFDVEVDGSFVTWKGAPASVGTLVDISEHVRAKEKISENEKRLQGLLEEKDLLLREVYHRTKNNMLVIISMLALQIDDIEDEKAIKIFEEMEHRIRAMALVHENLYQSENLVEINLGEYLAKMAQTQVGHMTFSDQIEVRANYCQVTVQFDQAVALGLIVSELITNAVKYAFPTGRKGIIRLQLKRTRTGLHLIVEDNGVGLPEDVDMFNPDSFGLMITANMITKQLRGTVEVERNEGTAFHIKFSLSDING